MDWPDESAVNLTDEELHKVENRLRGRGFVLTTKNSGKELLPGEYFKRSHHANSHDFSGPIVSDVFWKNR
jgi:hypothetical protein